MNKKILPNCILVLLTASLALAQEKGQNAQPSPKQQKLQALSEQIARAPDLQSAAAAFASGRALESYHVPLLEAYMRRTLEMGRRDVALIPARMILLVRPRHAQALSLLAFDEAGRGRHVQALEYATLGLLHGPQDKALRRNTAQLLAWYDRQQMPPRLENAVLLRIGKVRQIMRDVREFQQTYQAVMDTYARQDSVNEKIQQELAEQEKRYRQLNEHVLKIEASIREIDDDIRQEKSRARLLYARNWTTGVIPTTFTRTYYPSFQGGVYLDGEGGWYYGSGHVQTASPVIVRRIDYTSVPVYGARQDWALREEIRDIRSEIDKLEDRRAVLLAEGKALVPEWRRLGDKLGKISRNVDRTDQAVQRRLAWEPPTLAPGPAGPQKRAHRAGPAPGPARAVQVKKTPEEEAASILQLAELYAGNGHPGPARKYARQILAEFPQTTAAPKAAKLLGRLPQEP
jgi:hypothetical protein